MASPFLFSDALLQECVLEDGHTVMATITNRGYLLYTLNMLKSLQPYGLEKKVLLVCVDDHAASTLARLGYSAIVSVQQNHLGAFCPWNTKGYDRICYLKVELIYRMLSTGHHLLLMDGDLVFRKDPRVDMRGWWQDPLYQVWCQNDAMEDTDTNNMCTGYLYLKSTPALAETYNCVSSAGQARYKRCAFDNNDQTYFNRYVKPTVMMRALPLLNYPNGRRFYQDGGERAETVLVHFNWVHGHEKMAKMKEYRMWLLTEEEEDAVLS